MTDHTLTGGTYVTDRPQLQPGGLWIEKVPFDEVEKAVINGAPCSIQDSRIKSMLSISKEMETVELGQNKVFYFLQHESFWNTKSTLKIEQEDVACFRVQYADRLDELTKQVASSRK